MLSALKAIASMGMAQKSPLQGIIKEIFCSEDVMVREHTRRLTAISMSGSGRETSHTVTVLITGKTVISTWVNFGIKGDMVTECLLEQMAKCRRRSGLTVD